MSFAIRYWWLENGPGEGRYDRSAFIMSMVKTAFGFYSAHAFHQAE